MDLLDRFLAKKQKLLDQVDRGKKISEQNRADRLRRQANRISSLKPGAKKAIVEGLVMKKSVKDVMMGEWERRKYERNKRYGK